MSGSGRLVWIFFLLLAIALSGGCDCGDDDPSTSSEQADDDSDDDASDDDSDDDISPDDDITPDDDTTDDDQSPHISDENALIHYTNDPRFFNDLPFPLENGGWIQQIDYGQPGHDRTALAISADGYATIATTRGRQLVLYHHEPETPFDEWNEERLAQMAGGADLAVDSTGALHVAYTDLWDKSIVYATDRTGHWKFETVDVIGMLDLEHSLMIWNEVSLYIDADDNPHLAYNDPTDWSLKYAKRNDKGWQVETLPFSGAVGRTPDLLIDSQGHAHIAFGNIPDLSNEVVYYTHNDSGQWETSTVASPAIPASIAFDEQGNIDVAYIRVNYGTGWYSSYFTSSKSYFLIKEQVDEDGAGYNRIVVDTTGKKHYAYGHSWNSHDPRDVFYASSSDDDWEIETAAPDTLISVPKNLSLALDEVSSPNISYYFEGFFISRKEEKGWQIYQPTQYKTDLSYPTLTVDSEGALHLAFLDNDELIYATNKIGYWKSETITSDLPYNPYAEMDISVSSEGNVILIARIQENDDTYSIYNFYKDADQWQKEIITSGWTSINKPILKIGTDNIPIILVALSNDIEKNLILFKQEGNTWTEEAIEKSMTYYSMTLDEDNEPLISYRLVEESSGKSITILYFVYREGGEWVKEIVNETLESIGENSIAVDDNNDIFIASTNANGAFIKLWKRIIGEWTSEDVNDEFGENINLFFDNASQPYIVCYNDEAIISYIINNDEWKPYTIDDAGGNRRLTDAIMSDKDLYLAYKTEWAGFIIVLSLSE